MSECGASLPEDAHNMLKSGTITRYMFKPSLIKFNELSLRHNRPFKRKTQDDEDVPQKIHTANVRYMNKPLVFKIEASVDSVFEPSLEYGTPYQVMIRPDPSDILNLSSLETLLDEGDFKDQIIADLPGDVPINTDLKELFNQEYLIRLKLKETKSGKNAYKSNIPDFSPGDLETGQNVSVVVKPMFWFTEEAHGLAYQVQSFNLEEAKPIKKRK